MSNFSSMGRISALLLRYVYLLRSSWPRVIEIAYWPTMQMIIWGFVSRHFSSSSPELTAGGILISVVLVWDSLFRSHISYTLSFLEEMWSRNLGNLFVSPLRPAELIVALASVSLMRTLIGMVPAALLAIPFFGVSVFDMGLHLLAFFFKDASIEPAYHQHIPEIFSWPTHPTFHPPNLGRRPTPSSNPPHLPPV